MSNNYRIRASEMNGFSNHQISSLKIISLIYVINLISFTSSSSHLNQMKPCATFKSTGCANLALHRPSKVHDLNKLSTAIKDNHFFNHAGHSTIHLPIDSRAVTLKSPAYIPDHHFRLSPVDHTMIKQLDVYYPKYYPENGRVGRDDSNRTNELLNQNITNLSVSETLIKPVYALPNGKSLNQSHFLNATSLPLKRGNKPVEEINEDFGIEGNEAKEKIEQMNRWMRAEISQFEINPQASKQVLSYDSKSSKADVASNHIDKSIEMKQSESKLQSEYADYEDNDQQPTNKLIEKETTAPKKQPAFVTSAYNVATSLSGTSKTPPCATPGRFYCSYKEDYPDSIVAEITKYYKWPLEKLFRDLRQQVMPKLASDNYGGLVCDSITRVVRPGWARNTANRWLVVINTEEYQQYVTEILCREQNSRCNFIPPCYQATCKQRFNTQKLLVIDPFNRFKGPFLSEFLFPSCCVCYIPEQIDAYQTIATNVRPTYAKKPDDKAKIKLEF